MTRHRTDDDEDGARTHAGQVRRSEPGGAAGSHASPPPLAARVEKGQASDELFRLLVSSVSDYAIFLLDPEGRVATWNEGAQRLKGYRPEEILGRHFSVFYPASDTALDTCAAKLQRALELGRDEDEGWRIRKDGTRFWANVVVTAIRDDAGRLVGFAKVTRDLTERRRSEEERTLRLAAEQANRTKDEFLAVLGHELRNPLAPIVTALQLIKLRGEASFSKEHQVIERQVAHMIHLVDDLLDVSRVARGKVELNRKRVDLRDVLARAAEVASPLFESKQHHVELRRPPHPVWVHGDEPRLVQIFANLLTNAAKYTEQHGRVAIRIEEREAEAVVTVEDNGMGIDPKLLPDIFDMFVQGQQSSDRSVGGLGLGLTLVRSLAELHGGRIEATSEGPGKGSRFRVRLPIMAPVEASAQASSSRLKVVAGSDAERVLVVDDNEDARLLLVDLLRALGYEAADAPDGPTALELAPRFRPTLAILDIGLPVMDGYELAGQLRTRLAPSLPRLIALSGYGSPGDRARSQAAGFERHLVKPVEFATLLEAINELAAGPQREVASDPS